MAKYTNIETARALICDLCDCLYPDECCSKKCDWMEELEEDAVAPVISAKWKYYHKQNIAVCTHCSFERDLDADFGRAVACPNCGARMDGVTEVWEI